MPPRETPLAAWGLVAALWGVALLNYLDRQVIFACLPLLRDDLRIPDDQLGLLSGVFLWVYGLLSPFAGYVADKTGRARVIVIGLALWSAATWATAHAQTLEHLILTRVAMGVSEAFYLPAALALITERHSGSTRSLATGIHQSGLYMGIALGGAWGGWMAERYGWRMVFVVLGIVGICYWIFLALFIRRDAPRNATLQFGAAVSRLFRTRGFGLITAAFLSMSLANWLVFAWLPLFLYERFHLSVSQAGFTSTYLQIASYAGVLVGGYLIDRFAARRKDGRAYGQMIALAIAAPFLFAMGLTASLPLVIAATIAFGFGRGAFDCTGMPVLRQIAAEDLAATGYGVLNMVGCVSGGVATLMAGRLKQQIGLGAAFEASALVLALGAVAAWRIAVLIRQRGADSSEASAPAGL